MVGLPERLLSFTSTSWLMQNFQSPTLSKQQVSDALVFVTNCALCSTGIPRNQRGVADCGRSPSYVAHHVCLRSCGEIIPSRARGKYCRDAH